jgi:hypothetical protein
MSAKTIFVVLAVVLFFLAGVAGWFGHKAWMPLLAAGLICLTLAENSIQVSAGARS